MNFQFKLFFFRRRKSQSKQTTTQHKPLEEQKVNKVALYRATFVYGIERGKSGVAKIKTDGLERQYTESSRPTKQNEGTKEFTERNDRRRGNEGLTRKWGLVKILGIVRGRGPGAQQQTRKVRREQARAGS